MTRSQKKCLVVSLCCHGVLMGAIVVSAAFRSEPPIPSESILTLISSNVKITDRETTPGASGASVARPSTPVTRPTPTPVTPIPPSPPKPIPAEPRPQTHVEEVAPPRRTTLRPAQEETKIATTKTASETAPKKRDHEITPTFDPVTPIGKTSSKNSTPAPTSRSNSQTENNQRLSKEIDEAFSQLNSSLNSKEADAKPSLPAVSSGEAFLGYRTAIVNAYYRAWMTPDDTTRRISSAVVKIVVARDGSVISAEITHSSGDARTDRSVQHALDTVKSLPPFPEGATDAQRTFNIRFNLDAKESAG